MRKQGYKRAGVAAAALAAVSLLGAPAAQATTDSFDVCPSGLTGVATSDTSCAFADNVRAAWYTQPGRTVFTYSPVTDRFYTMQCDYAWTTAYWSNPKRCYGINAFGAPLVVYIA
jgi:hypothetical protein